MSLQQRLEQKNSLRLSPQQLLVQKLIALNQLDLEKQIQQELTENPILELDKTDEAEAESEIDAPSAEEGEEMEEELPVKIDQDFLNEDSDDWESEPKTYDSREYVEGFGEFKTELKDSNQLNIQEHLQQQLNLLSINPRQRFIGQELLGSIDEWGYLPRKAEALVDDLAFKQNQIVSEDEVQTVWEMLKHFDPPGIAAFNLQESLLIQIRRRKTFAYRSIALAIIEDYYEAFRHKNFDKIERGLEIDKETLNKIFIALGQLNPYPLRGRATDIDLQEKVYADYLITHENGEFSLSINSSKSFKLKINQEYLREFQAYEKDSKNEVRSFAKQMIDHAHMYKQALQQREKTLHSILKCLLVLQKDYFTTGNDEDIKPMILKDIASKVDKDISTISKALSGKHIQTNWGIVPCKHLFVEAVQQEEGEQVSHIQIEKTLQQIISEENKQEPFADDALVLELKKKGFMLARRTIAKYRENLHIPIAKLRKSNEHYS